VGVWTGFNQLKIKETREHGNEPSDSIKGEEFLDYLMTISFTKRTQFHGVT
jgi:hypothetical protein